jgi:hypothetical protein
MTATVERSSTARSSAASFSASAAVVRASQWVVSEYSTVPGGMPKAAASNRQPVTTAI